MYEEDSEFLDSGALVLTLDFIGGVGDFSGLKLSLSFFNLLIVSLECFFLGRKVFSFGSEPPLA